MSTPNIFRGRDGELSIEKIVGAIVVAICIWMGSSVHKITISNAKIETTMEHRQKEMEKLNATFDSIARSIRNDVDAVKSDLHTMRIEQGRRTGDVAKVELLESKVSKNSNEIHELDRRITRVESMVTD